MNTKDQKKEFGGIRVPKKFIQDANAKLKKQSTFSSLPHLVKIIVCKKLGLNASDY